MNPMNRMLETIQDKYNLESPQVFKALKKVPREKFAPKKYKTEAYMDKPIPIGHGQTMSQPYTVAFMTQLLSIEGNEKVLEIGTGSGYQAAVLAELAESVYTVEIIKDLAKNAEKKFKKLGYDNIKIKIGSGENGWMKFAPYDAILVTADIGGEVPEELFSQLKKGGKLVAPVNGIIKKYKKNGKIKEESHGRFDFVPFVETSK